MRNPFLRIRHCIWNEWGLIILKKMFRTPLGYLIVKKSSKIINSANKLEKEEIIDGVYSYTEFNGFHDKTYELIARKSKFFIKKEKLYGK